MAMRKSPVDVKVSKLGEVLVVPKTGSALTLLTIEADRFSVKLARAAAQSRAVKEKLASAPKAKAPAAKTAKPKARKVTKKS